MRVAPRLADVRKRVPTQRVPGKIHAMVGERGKSLEWRDGWCSVHYERKRVRNRFRMDE